MAFLSTSTLTSDQKTNLPKVLYPKTYPNQHFKIWYVDLKPKSLGKYGKVPHMGFSVNRTLIKQLFVTIQKFLKIKWALTSLSQNFWLTSFYINLKIRPCIAFAK